MVVVPFCDCRLCCRDEMEIKKTAHAGRLFFCPSAVGGGAYIFASSESHRNAHRTPPPLRPYNYTTEPTNATQRATESHREPRSKRPKHRPAEPPTGPAAPTQGGRGAEKDRHRHRAGSGQIFKICGQNFARQNLGLCLSKFRPSKFQNLRSKFQNLRSKFSRSNSRL